MRIPIVLGVSLQDGLGALFGLCVILWAINRAYVWIIKPDMEGRRRRAEELIEEIHRRHWKEFGRKLPKKK